MDMDITIQSNPFLFAEEEDNTMEMRSLMAKYFLSMPAKAKAKAIQIREIEEFDIRRNRIRKLFGEQFGDEVKVFKVGNIAYSLKRREVGLKFQTSEWSGVLSYPDILSVLKTTDFDQKMKNTSGKESQKPIATPVANESKNVTKGEPKADFGSFFDFSAFFDDTLPIPKKKPEVPEDKKPTSESAGSPIEEFTDLTEFLSGTKASASRGTNYYGGEYVVGGPAERVRNNISAIKLLKQLDKENRPATKEEQAVLAAYVGWGGCSAAFDANGTDFRDAYAELKEILTEEEYSSAMASTTTAFYTSPEIIKAMYIALMSFGFKGGTVLEPSMGVGNFFRFMPWELQDTTKKYGVEIDSVSGRIAQYLFPDANIRIQGFENAELPGDNFFDLVISNCPFGNFKVFDPEFTKYNFYIHDYFFAKALKKVRSGGIVAFVTSTGTMDKQNDKLRRYMAERAEFIGGIRLPEGAFANAGTSTSTDILFFQKSEGLRMNAADEFLSLGENEDGITLNRYFLSHPEMVLGKMAVEKGMFGAGSERVVCKSNGTDLKEALPVAVGKLRATFTALETTADDEEDGHDCLPADPNVRNFTFTYVNGDLYYREDSMMFKRQVGDTINKRIAGLCNVRDVLRTLLQLQMDGCEDDVFEDAKLELNRVYDRYVAKYGNINSRGNSLAFRDDADYPLLCSLENDEPDGTYSKAAIFFKRTVKPDSKFIHVTTAIEALRVCLNERGCVDLSFLHTIYPMDCDNQSDYVKAITKALDGMIYRDPTNTDGFEEGWVVAEEYLSGNVRKKLFEAQEAAAADSFYDANVAALLDVIPSDIPASEITVKPGVLWVDVSDYNAFMQEVIWKGSYGHPRAFYTPSLALWKVEANHYIPGDIPATHIFGTGRMDAYSILEHLMNNAPIIIYDKTIDSATGKDKNVLNPQETILAREKADVIVEAFRKWLFETDERREKYVRIYNDRFNAIVLRSYDGSYLTFPGMNPQITLEPHQKNAIARALLSGNTLLAHAVGAGKSFEMCAIAYERKRLGLSNKPIIIVPKSLVLQTANEFLRLYPSANLLVSSERDFEKKRRKRFISKIATGDYDCVIMSHNQFEKISVPKSYKKEILNRRLAEVMADIEENQHNWGRRRLTVKDLERRRKSIEAQLKELDDKEEDSDIIDFFQTGIDALIVDEAHNFKNLCVFSRMQVSGVSNTASKKADDMLYKTQYINETTNYRAVVFATGTPVSNTMGEMYVMQRYLRPDALEERGILGFDGWALSFGEITSGIELGVDGKFSLKSRFNRFCNLPELLQMFCIFADIQTSDMLNLDVPEIRDGYQVICSEPDECTKETIESFAERAEAIHNGAVDPEVDNFLKITSEARLLGVDARLLDENAPVNPDGKLFKVVDNVIKEYHFADEHGIKGTQLIFSDVGTPSDKFNVYDFIKYELIRRGIPKEEIAYIHDAKTDAQKETLFKRMNDGDIRILLGSTSKLGTGVNVQNRLIACHHVDAPWRPSDIEQREGRILRRGCSGIDGKVSIYRYVTKGTFDSYNWNVLENKQRFISQIMTNRVSGRDCEDVDEVSLNFAICKEIATGDDTIKQKMEVDNKVAKLKLLRSSYYKSLDDLKEKITTKIPNMIRKYSEIYRNASLDLEELSSLDISAEGLSASDLSTTYVGEEAVGKHLANRVAEIPMCEIDDAFLCNVGKFRISASRERSWNGILDSKMWLKLNHSYSTDLLRSSEGLIRRLRALFDTVKEVGENAAAKVAELEEELSLSKADYSKPFEREDELNEALKLQSELNVKFLSGHEIG